HAQARLRTGGRRTQVGDVCPQRPQRSRVRQGGPQVRAHDLPEEYRGRENASARDRGSDCGVQRGAADPARAQRRKRNRGRGTPSVRFAARCDDLQLATDETDDSKPGICARPLRSGLPLRRFRRPDPRSDAPRGRPTLGSYPGMRARRRDDRFGAAPHSRRLSREKSLAMTILLHVNYIGTIVAFGVLVSTSATLGWMLHPPHSRADIAARAAEQTLKHLVGAIIVVFSSEIHSEHMMALAARIARGQKADVLAAYVIEVPFMLPANATMEVEDRTALDVLAAAEAIAHKYGTHVRTTTIHHR